MAARSASDLIPVGDNWEQLRDAAAGCQACDLWRRGTQTVFGEGSPRGKRPPSSILRAPDSETRHAGMARFVADLRHVKTALEMRTRKAR